jgi:hypothetical protein
MPLTPANPPEIFAAIRVGGGGVQKGAKLTQAQAENERKNGNDVVVCGPIDADNQTMAQAIETAAGPPKQCVPHLKSAGPGALPGSTQQRIFRHRNSLSEKQKFQPEPLLTS